ncbi:MAG: hydroxyethylthiazole kinase [Alphaproteobacteria bacterium]|nr:MAG: hydroxyethylthiazole kinase [Alphaproteobacteria bacterium]
MPEMSVTARLRAIGEERPAVHCLTNTVVQGLTANMLLAVGAIPSMSADIREIRDFVKGAAALLVNLGTLDAARIEANAAAIETATANNIPWILDPVLIDRAAARCRTAKELMRLRPALIRGNAGEIAMLAADAKTLAQKTGAIVAVTGATDYVTDGTCEITLEGGHMLMSRVTGIGCAGTALLGAFCGVTERADYLNATAAGLQLLGSAGELAARDVAGPGTFAARLLDEIFKAGKASLQNSRKDND